MYIFNFSLIFSHKNATVRAAAARLLVNLTLKLGPERVLASPRDMRDKVLLTGANMLTEGSLETRFVHPQNLRRTNIVIFRTKTHHNL